PARVLGPRGQGGRLRGEPQLLSQARAADGAVRFDHRLHRSLGAVRVQARAAGRGAGGAPAQAEQKEATPAPARAAPAKPPAQPAPAAKSAGRAEKPADATGEAKV